MRLYTVPRLHRFTTRTVYKDPNSLDDDVYDPSYEIEGIQVFLHYVNNFIQDNKIRVAITLQIGKWIITDESDQLCFWAG
jgi:hypothetical protein